MAVELSVAGADKLGDVARRLRETGDKALRAELLRGINRATRPLKAAAQQSARDRLPRRGGLNEFVASSKFSTSTRTGRDPAVRITATKAGHDVRALDRGRLRHPLFGNRRHWFNQQVPAGWFTDAMEAGAPVVRRSIVDVLDDVAKKVARG